jgi:endonuclease G, mitochondrial
MLNRTLRTFAAVGFLAVIALATGAAALRRPVELRPIVIDPTYHHDRFITAPRDIFREMGAYVVSFDGDDDDDRDADADRLAIPEWVAYEIRRFEGELPPAPDRPSEWISDEALHTSGIMPLDNSYHFANAWRQANPTSPMLGYDRGHLCMKHHAWRLGADADWNTHFLMNCCPQKGDLNQGIWLDLEEKTAHWADRYGAVWIVCGPIVYGRDAESWLGQENEIPVAIPDAFFKIVIKNATNGGLDVLAFIYPQTGIDYRVRAPKTYTHVPYLASVDEIEALTGLDFLTDVDDAVENVVEAVVQVGLWE